MERIVEDKLNIWLRAPSFMGRFKLLALDLDETVWAHPDISATRPPYKRVSRDVIIDVHGETIELRRGVRETLEELKSRGVKLAVISWNDRSKALEALEALGLLELFDVLVIEPHPRKDLMMSKIVEWCKERGIRVSEVLYVDDSPLMMEVVKKAWPEVVGVVYGLELKGFEELREIVLDP